MEWRSSALTGARGRVAVGPAEALGPLGHRCAGPALNHSPDPPALDAAPRDVDAVAQRLDGVGRFGGLDRRRETQEGEGKLLL